MNYPIPIKIDFNKHTFESLVEHLEEQGKNFWEYEVILDKKQFQTFKLMYKSMKNHIDEHFIRQETVIPTPMGSVYGLSYRVE